MDNIASESDLTKAKQNSPRPVVFVLLDSWGIGPDYAGNIFTDLKLKNFSTLVKNYPTAVLSANLKNKTERYQILGAGGLLSQSLSLAGLSQLNIVESEKLILAWHHFNGGRDKLLLGEDLQVVSSKTGDRQNDSEQSSQAIIKFALTDIKKGHHDFLIVNLSNLDLVSAAGDLLSAQKAAKLIDKNLGRLASSVLKQKGLLIVSAAYGHAETMINMASGLPETGITNNPVPFIIVGHDYQGRSIGLPEAIDSDLSLVESSGTLEDVASTILKFFNITPPPNMLGESLI